MMVATPSAAALRAARRFLKHLAVVTLRTPWWLWLACLVALLFVALFVAVKLGEQFNAGFGKVVVVFAVVLFAANIIWRVILEEREVDRRLAADPEFGFSWLYESQGSSHKWRFKAAPEPSAAVKKVRVEVIRFLALTTFLAVSLTGFFAHLLVGGLRAKDLPTFLPFAATVIALFAIVASVAWRAAFGLTPIEVRYDEAQQLLELLAVQPFQGVAKRAIRVDEILRLSVRSTSFKGIAVMTVSLKLKSGESQMLFANLSLEEWGRIGSRLPNMGR
jgi:hypothetical protein